MLALLRKTQGGMKKPVKCESESERLFLFRCIDQVKQGAAKGEGEEGEEEDEAEESERGERAKEKRGQIRDLPRFLSFKLQTTFLLSLSWLKLTSRFFLLSLLICSAICLLSACISGCWLRSGRAEGDYDEDGERKLGRAGNNFYLNLNLPSPESEKKRAGQVGQRGEEE